MMNLFVVCKRFDNQVLLVLFIVAAAYSQWALKLDVFLLLVTAVAALFMYFRSLRFKEERALADAIADQIKQVANGDLDGRITGAVGNSRQLRVVRNLNKALDQIELTMKETGKVFVSAAAGRSHR